jgi:AbrB family looped-hinge helix DNA binding protein
MPFINGKCHDKMPFMTATLTLDKAGRVVLPKPIRDDLHLQPGDSLSLESSEDQIVLRPVRGGMPLRRKHGIWVFRAGEPLAAEVVAQTIKAIREDRDRGNIGRHRSRQDQPNKPRSRR